MRLGYTVHGMSGTEKGSRLGRPRDRGIDRRLSEATIDVLRESGYDALTFDKVAVKAGVSRPTIYRRWPNKAALIAYVLNETVPPLDVPDDGSPLEKVKAAAVGLILALQRSGIADSVLAVHAHARRDPELASSVMLDYLAPRGALLDTLLAAAKDAGEIKAAISIDVARDILFGPVIYRWLVVGETVDHTLARTLVETAAGALTRPERQPGQEK